MEQKTSGYYEMLDELIGLKNVKEQIRKIAAFAKMKKAISSSNLTEIIPVSLNMEFTGNPGTAKTTVARIVAGIFYEIGLIQSKEILEVGRADLVAKYVGHTADKVKEVFQQARGKLLFIDEAYSLAEPSGYFGDEAIDTIVQEMENNRDKTVVIFAGYPDRMRELFDRNQGLRSRVPFSIVFSDYTVEEMTQICELEAKKRGFEISEEAMGETHTICDQAVRNPEAGNGRFCRNLIESAVINFTARVYGNDDIPETVELLLEKDDIYAQEVEHPDNSLHTIGFQYMKQ